MNDNNDPRQVSPTSQESTEQTTPTRASPRLANTPGRARRMVTNTPPAAVVIALEQMQLGPGVPERSTPLPKPRRAVSPSKAAASRLKTDAEKEEVSNQCPVLFGFRLIVFDRTEHSFKHCLLHLTNVWAKVERLRYPRLHLDQLPQLSLCLHLYRLTA